MKKLRSIILRNVILTCIGSLALPALLAHGSDHAGQLTEEFHQTYPLSAGGRLELDNINGAVHITGWDRNEVKVDAVKYANSKERLNEAKIQVEASSSSVSIRTEYPDHDLTFNSFGRNNPASVEYTLTVPRNARLDEIKLVNGALDIQAVSGDVNASSVNGGVTVRGSEGRTEVSTVNGRLEVEFSHLTATAELSSVNGGLMVTLPSDAKAEIEASTVSGRISNDFGLEASNHNWVGHELKAELSTGGPRIKLSNVNGRIEIRHANDGKALSPAKNLSHDDKDDDDDDSI